MSSFVINYFYCSTGWFIKSAGFSVLKLSILGFASCGSIIQVAKSSLVCRLKLSGKRLLSSFVLLKSIAVVIRSESSSHPSAFERSLRKLHSSSKSKSLSIFLKLPRIFSPLSLTVSRISLLFWVSTILFAILAFLRATKPKNIEPANEAIVTQTSHSSAQVGSKVIGTGCIIAFPFVRSDYRQVA